MRILWSRWMWPSGSVRALMRLVIVLVGVVVAALVAGAAWLIVRDGDGSSSSTPALVGPVWQWEEYLGGDDSTVAPDDPSKYTIEFRDDGSVSVRADCNRGFGSYAEQGGSLTIDVSGVTQALCEQDSLSDRYLRDLAQVRTYAIEDGKLFLNLMADAGDLRHARG